jgi:hypothetical protein
MSGTRFPWILQLPASTFQERTVKLSRKTANDFVSAIRGAGAEAPRLDWSRDDSSKYGEDLVGGWLLKNGGLIEGLKKEETIPIPPGGNSPDRRADWLLGGRIIVEVKTYVGDVIKGGNLDNTRQFEDYSLWRDQMPSRRAIVLARVSWKGNSKIEALFREDLRHFRVPVIFFTTSLGIAN